MSSLYPKVGQSVQFIKEKDYVPLAGIVVKVHEQNVDSYIAGSVDLVVYHTDGQRWTQESRVPPDFLYKGEKYPCWRPVDN